MLLLLHFSVMRGNSSSCSRDGGVLSFLNNKKEASEKAKMEEEKRNRDLRSRLVVKVDHICQQNEIKS